MKLAEELTAHGFVTELVSKVRKPYLMVANADTPSLNERVLCEPAADNGAWSFWWPWRQPIGSVDDLDAVIEKITAVLRSVEVDEADG